jgi:glycosyltransferase involved in cell wall biosynthesis
VNLLYVSNQPAKPWQGPYHSIPSQVNAQKRIDNVLWLNTNHDICDEWEETGCYLNLSDVPSGKISDLPAPFSKPDFVVFQGVYNHKNPLNYLYLRKKRIPYTILPMSSLTMQAQKKSWYKKLPANFVFYKPFTRNAAGIHYSTTQESIDSTSKWNKRFEIIPNGVDAKRGLKSEFNTDRIVFTFVGRVEWYQKGLDLLIEALRGIVEELIANGVRIRIFGPNCEKSVEKLMNTVVANHLDSVVSFDEGVFGDEKESVLLDSDVFLLTSRFEGHPMALIEALSYGLPCLITRGTTMYDEVCESGAGWVAENTSQSIQNAILTMIKEREKLPLAGKNALELSKKYSWKSIAQKTHSVYQEWSLK